LGNDKLTLGDFTNLATVAGAETIAGGIGNDTITLGSAFTTSQVINLAAGSDKLTFGDFTNAGSLSNVETVIGGSGADTITIATQVSNGMIDLGAGFDVLDFSNFANTATVANVESITGGGGNDTITISSGATTILGGGGVDQVTGSSSADVFVFDQATSGNVMTIFNMGSGADVIALDTDYSSTLTGNAFVTMSPLADGTNIAAVADAAARLATTSAIGGLGGFVYQQDAGELYYSSNGDFAGGGILIGILTTDGSTAWTYDFTKFTDV
jgi:Ca2+-binding RTX toxin-like protein